MFSPKDDAKVKCIRLNTGEVIMGFVKQKSDGDQIIEEPQIILTTAESGKMQVDFAPMDSICKRLDFCYFKRTDTDHI